MGVNLDMDDHVYVYQGESFNLIKLYEVYKVSKGSTPVIRQFGNWSLGDEQQHILDMISTTRSYKRNDFGVSGPRKPVSAGFTFAL